MNNKKNEPRAQGEVPQPGAGETRAEERAQQVELDGPSGIPETGEAEGPIDSAEDLRQQLEAQGDRYLRLMAEFDNFKKRVSRDYERLVESANERLMSELIEIRENFERAIKSGEQCADSKALFEGMKLIFTKLDGVLNRNGLEPFAMSGEPFNPQLHDAMMKVPNEKIPEDHIVEVFEKGYTLKKRVIRHARVIVSSGSPAKKDNKQA